MLGLGLLLDGQAAGGAAGPAGDARLLEDGSYRLLEDGSYRLLE
jgi:hypothetical protein